MSRVKDLLAGTGYWLGWKALCHLPESWVRWAFTTVTDIAWRRQGHGVQVLEGNLLRVLGPGVSGKELRAVSRAGMRSYGRYWMEVFRLPAVGTERILRDMQINADADQALADVAHGKGGDLRAAAHGQLGGGRRLRRRRAALNSRRSPSGSSPSRCSTCSSRSARAWAWRC